MPKGGFSTGKAVLWPAGIVIFACLLSVSSAVAAPAPAVEGGEITVYAAVSLRDALNELAPRCESAAGVKLFFNFGASNELARQITAGNKADVFVSADEGWMDHVAKAGLVDASSRRPLVTNRLVVIAPNDSTLKIDGASALAAAPSNWISLANPDAVPAGKYARAWLESARMWSRLEARVLPATDARAALSAVESGGAELGVVYATDAAISGKVRVLYRVSEAESGVRIVYPVAALQDRPNLAAAKRVINCLAGPEARALFERRGFTPPPSR